MWEREGEGVCLAKLDWYMLSRNVLPGVSVYNLFLFLNREFSELSVYSTNFAKKQSLHETPTFMEEW